VLPIAAFTRTRQPPALHPELRPDAISGEPRNDWETFAGPNWARDTVEYAVRAAKNIVTEIGEATKALSSTTADAITDVPWRAIAGMRDRTIHRYSEVDFDVLWDTMEHDLLHLEQRIRQHLNDVIPPATMLTTLATGMRRPRRHGTPPITAGSMVIRSICNRLLLRGATPGRRSCRLGPSRVTNGPNC
jgi:uncharacterized protein with HEPN domain